MPLKHNLQNALLNLKAGNFTAYISALAALGADISNELGIKSIKELAAKVTEPNRPLPQLSLDNLQVLHNRWTIEELHQLKISAALWASAWSKNHDNTATHIAKLKLNTSTRHLVHLGMLAIESSFNSFSANEIVNLSDKKMTELLGTSEKIYQAISTYETKRQKIVRYIGKGLAFSSSLAFGLAETGVAVFFMGMLLFSPAGWLALSGLLVGAVAAGGIFSYISYCTLKNDVPSLLQEVAGKDRALQGFLQYKNEEGKTVHFNKKQIASLAIFTGLFALPTAVATGAVGFTSILSIPTILALFGVTVASSVFPPIAIAFAAIIAVTMTLFLAKSFHSFLANHHGNPISFIRKPFDEVNQIINEKIDPIARPIANKVAKIVSHTLTGLFCAMGVAGLAVSALGGVNSVTALMTRLFKTPLQISAAVGVCVGGIISFSSRVIQTIAKSGGAIVNLFKLGAHKSSEKTDKFGLVTGILFDLPLSVFFWMDSFLRPPSTSPILPMPNTVKPAALATACTTMRDAGLVVNSMFVKKGQLQSDPIREKKQITEIADGVNLNKQFVSKPGSLQQFSLFKSNEEDTKVAFQNDEIATDRLARSYK